MKTILPLLLIFLWIGKMTTAQVSMRENIRFNDTVKVEKYKTIENGFSVTKIRMTPGEHTILNPKDVALLKNQTIIQVDLVYSDYPVGSDFSELNRKRILELYILLPEAFNSSIIDWNIVKQTGVESTNEMQNYFHGFVVYYRKMPTFQEEHKAILDVVDRKVSPQDSSILKVFERQPTWKNMLVVTDVTGSMAPYTAQILLWIKANQKLKTFKQIVFFNDDEENSNTQTNSYDSTGIWTIESSNADKVIDLAFKAMEKGNHIENDLEAVCYAIRKYPENKNNVVLIADNWENPCDMKLIEFLKQQKVPLKIVVCGVKDRMNTLYLDLAYATGGSVHTMEEDLTNIAQMGNGKTFKLNGMTFMMSAGKFIQIEKKNQN
ncbi:hypothetical protein [Fluviicola taffensis]|uniref:hypothetical protein n=1 Tax=Fluviicola taffensis TaxID=191579 RepID=UPI00313810EE